MLFFHFTAPVVESDSDHEPSSTVTIPTPPRNSDIDEINAVPPIEELQEKSSEVDDSMSKKDTNKNQSPTRPPSEFVWKGSISMVDVAQISITAHEVSGNIPLIIQHFVLMCKKT